MTRPDLPAVALADSSATAAAAPILRPGLSGLAPDALTAWLAERGEPSYRARQVNEAVFGGTVTAIDDIAPLPGALRRDLAAAFRFDTLAETDVRVTDEGLTEKALHTLADGSLIESVLMHYPARRGARERNTLCISSQVGCAVGCPFCATGELGFGRDLQTAEIVDQVRHASRRLIAAKLSATLADAPMAVLYKESLGILSLMIQSPWATPRNIGMIENTWMESTSADGSNAAP